MPSTTKSPCLRVPASPCLPGLLFICGSLAFALDNDPPVTVTPLHDAVLFDAVEFRLDFQNAAAFLTQLPDTQIHDAYDADRDGTYVRIDAQFTQGVSTVTVPAFAMRDKPGGPWQWRVRWAPRATGAYDLTLTVDACANRNAQPLHLSTTFKEIALVKQNALTADGPLVMPSGNEDPRYLRRLNPDGTSSALWLFGAARAWVAVDQDEKGKWAPNEWLDRETELFPLLRSSGYNLLNQWMAPWEFGLIHHDRAERWQSPAATEKRATTAREWKRIPLPETSAWTPYQCFDQGRAAAFDELVSQCEGAIVSPQVPRPPVWRERTIHLLLSPLPHQGMQVKEHPWGGSESGWSPANDAGKQGLERLNGFSAFKKDMSIWEFFDADPSKPLDDWRSQLFDHQANFYRYLIARWSASRAIGVWVIVDELDAVGDTVGSMKEKTGWWAHPQCDAWLANVFRLFHGGLKRSDGLAYSGDPFHHPLHAATTSTAGQSTRGANLDWPGPWTAGILPASGVAANGNPPAVTPSDLFGWHWYPSWKADSTWGDVFAYTAAGIGSYARAPLGAHPRLISEFGAPDRDAPGDAPSALYPTMYHVAIWAAILSGQAGTPMDWDDGKEFGELCWRERKGLFDKEHYPIDNAAELVALKKFLGDLKPDDVDNTRILCDPTDPAVQVYALHTKRSPDRLYGWLFSTLRNAPFTIKGLRPGAYTLTWFDPWTGVAIPNLPPEEIIAKENEGVKVDALNALKALRANLKPFPAQSRESKGHDAAFQLISK